MSITLLSVSTSEHRFVLRIAFDILEGQRHGHCSLIGSRYVRMYQYPFCETFVTTLSGHFQYDFEQTTLRVQGAS